MFVKIQVVLVLAVVGAGVAITHDIGVITSKNRLTNKLIQMLLPIDDIIIPSLEMAVNNCREQFKWDRWNCPSNDFLTKRSAQIVDREAAFVRAITVASLIYTVTKNCTRGELTGCGCRINAENSRKWTECSETTDFGEQLVEEILEGTTKQSMDLQGHVEAHNNRAGRAAVRNALQKHCRCYGLSGSCTMKSCWKSLNAFPEIAASIRQMYEKAVMVTPSNSGTVDLKKIPEDTLVYMVRSPDYCQENVIPGWKGMRGRQCSRNKNKDVSSAERRSCKNLCRSCGLRVRSEEVIQNQRCNCKFTWCCEVTCDSCSSVEEQHFCE